MPQSDANKKIPMGRFGAPFGIQGWVKVISFTVPKVNILEFNPWYIKQHDGHWQEMRIEAGKPHGENLVVKLPGCDDRDIAMTYTNLEIAIERTQLPELAANEFYWSDLIGLTVINLEGETLGQVKELMATGANDVLVVEGERERLIPYLKHVVKTVDLAQHKMIVDWDSTF